MQWSDSNLLIQAAVFRPESLQEPGSWIGHIPFANWLVNRTRPNVIVELGTHSGNSYFAFCQSVKEARLTTQLYAVDTWEGDEHAGFYDESVFELVTRENQKYLKNSTLVRSRFADAVGRFSDESIDILHIDGLHTYEAVKQDFITWLPKVARGGFVLLHDIHVRTSSFGVYRLWEELEKSYPSLNFSHSNGLGVIEIPKEDGTRVLSNLDFSTTLEIASFFSSLGSAIEFELLLEVNQRKLKELVGVAAELAEIRSSKTWRLTSLIRKFGSLRRDGNWD